ncbi:MAG TPA: DPP IV N-terminal domain-containing protein [Thermomicrobiales bacterium]|nr:DPP IV N-terminal domain-containing protein [Thermomicrobiales bacterium]
MPDAPMPDMTAAYEVARLWRPEKREEALRGVVKSAFADAGSDGGFAVIHDFGKKRLVQFDIHSGEMTAAADNSDPQDPANPRTPVSPDGKHRIDLRDFNLWLVDLDTGQEKQLTTDGTADHPYGQGRQSRPYNEFMSRPVFLWSPDGRYVVTQRLDLRGVNIIVVTESAPRGGGLPTTHEFIDAFPGDERVPELNLLIVDTYDGTIVQADLEPVAATHTSPLMRRDLWWSTTTGNLYFVHSTRDWLQLSLVEINPANGSTRVLVHEENTKRIRPNTMFHQEPNVAVNDLSGTATEAIWFSERDGWGHLYLYDAETGKCKSQITNGEYLVSRNHRVDWSTRTLWASIAGLIEQDVYRETVCRIHIDTGEITRLFEDNFDHRVLMTPASPERHPWFLDASSTVADPTRYTVRSWDGEVLVDLGQIDISTLVASGWRSPERFRAKAADGITEIFGTLFFPPHFDPAMKYPVVDHVYPGPQDFRSVPYFEGDEVEPFAALGMIGVTIDGRGTPMRERAFTDASWQNVGAGSGLEDHVAAIKELAETRAWIDADNVAVYGHSAGGFAAARAMELFPDFYKVGIAAGGRFEGRMVMAMIMEAYDDPYDAISWQRASAVEFGGDITGKFLIVHGEMDVDCTVFHAYRLIDRMIEADRDFDLLVIPGDDHVFSNRGTYVERRIWDYLTEHVLHAMPPRGFRIDNTFAL